MARTAPGNDSVSISIKFVWNEGNTRQSARPSDKLLMFISVEAVVLIKSSQITISSVFSLTGLQCIITSDITTPKAGRLGYVPFPDFTIQSLRLMTSIPIKKLLFDKINQITSFDCNPPPITTLSFPTPFYPLILNCKQFQFQFT